MLREIDRRVMYITKRLEVVTVVDYAPQQDGYVYFGAFVKIENDSGENLSFQIVGPDEIYGHNDRVSIDSPMASALIKKQIGDEAVVKTPKGPVSWYVTDITYDPLGFVKF